MSELCGAFKRIVPRYQFSTNQAAFIVEDMGDIPNRHIPQQPPQNKCGTGWNGPSPCPSKGTQCRNGPHRMYVHRKCHWPQSCTRCTEMDTCGNLKNKMCYYHSYTH